MISQETLDTAIKFLNMGRITAGEFVLGLIEEGFSSLKNILFSTMSDILPIAFAVAGAILVVNLGWRLFKNFTRG